jgi:tRNA G18 (ribose-2'-O)-methylase SpoU
LIGFVLITQYSFGQNLAAAKSNNVIDIYKQWTAAEVRADLQKNRTDLVTIMLNLTHDFNKSAAIRSNNAFLGKEVYIVGRRKYNTRGDVGTRHYEKIFHADTLQEVVDKLHVEGYAIYAVDNQMEYNPVNLWDEDFPRKSAFVFGEEQRGLSKEEIELCDKMIYVAMYGSVRSLNVASCATVIMAEYSRRYR